MYPDDDIYARYAKILHKGLELYGVIDTRTKFKHTNAEHTPWGKAMYNQLPKDYSFAVSSVGAINPFKMVEDLSPEKPLAYAVFSKDSGTYEDTGAIVCIHVSLAAKAIQREELPPFYNDNGLFHGGNLFIELGSVKDLSKIIRWAKDMKQASWPDKTPGMVKVTFPRI